MSDYRGRLIDTAARAAFAHEWGDRWVWEAADDSDHAYWLAHGEAVIDALRVSYCGKAMEYPWTQQRDTWYIACLEAPAVQTHDYSSDPETRHGP